MKSYVKITTVLNTEKTYIVGPDVKESVEKLKKSMIECSPITLEDDYGAIDIINPKHIVKIEVWRIERK